MKIVDRAKARIGQVKADRSTKMGVAGHEEAARQMGRAVGGYGAWGSRISNNSNVNVIPAGSKPATAKNSDWGDLPKY